MALSSLKTLHGLAAALLLLAASSACSTRGLPDEAELCRDPRPQICTAIYDPVCAYRPGQKLSPSTYASDCSACADPEVIGYVRGACSE